MILPEFWMLAAGAAPKGSMGLAPGWLEDEECVVVTDEPIFKFDEEEKPLLVPKLDQLFVDWFCTGLVPVVGQGLVFNWVRLDVPKKAQQRKLIWRKKK